MTHTAPPDEPTTGHPKRPVFRTSLRILAMPIVLFWIVVAVLVNVIAPQLEVVGELHSAPMAPEDAPSMKAMKLMGGNFQEFNSNSTMMVVIEGQQPLGPDAHKYYDEIIRKLRQDPDAHPAHPGLLGRHADRGRRAERRRQGLLRDAQPRRRAGPDAGQRRRRGRPQGHRGDQGPAGREGLRRGPGGAHRRSARHRQRQPRPDHPVHPRRDRGHAAGRLPLDHHHADPAVPDVPRIADGARSGVGAGHATTCSG